MKIQLDENMPARLVVGLRTLGHDVDTVPAEGFAGRLDNAVWRAAQETERLLITQDLDFSDVRQFRPGTHHGLLLLRLNVPGREALLQRVITLFQTEDVKGWTGCLVVATDIKIRVRRPR
jgi:predicted nuclease of predicted toxin-antitoxin system